MTQSTTHLKPTYFKALTGIRAIAASMVFFHHMNPFSGKPGFELLADFTNEFHVGVTIFFVLSGFLIAYRYFEQANELSLRKYFLNRFARIYPVYFVLVTLSFFLSGSGFSGYDLPSGVIYLLNITFLKGFSTDLVFSGINQSWSLTVEEVFYLLAPLIFILVQRHKRNLILLPMLFLGFGFLLVFCFSGVSFLGFFSKYEFMMNYTFFGRCCEFFLGIALAVYWKKIATIIRFKGITYLSAAWIVGAIILIVCVKGEHDFGIRTPFGMVCNTLILPIGVCGLFYGLITEKTWFSSLLSSKPLVLIGKSSYVFYLIHVGFIASFLNQYLNLYSLYFALIIVSIIIWFCVEEPLNRWVRTW